MTAKVAELVEMQFLLDLQPEEVVLETIDTDELSRIAKDSSFGSYRYAQS